MRKKPRKLTGNQKAALADIAADNKQLYKGYLLKEQLREALEVKGQALRGPNGRYVPRGNNRDISPRTCEPAGQASLHQTRAHSVQRHHRTPATVAITFTVAVWFVVAAGVTVVGVGGGEQGKQGIGYAPVCRRLTSPSLKDGGWTTHAPVGCGVTPRTHAVSAASAAGGRPEAQYPGAAELSGFPSELPLRVFRHSGLQDPSVASRA